MSYFVPLSTLLTRTVPNLIAFHCLMYVSRADCWGAPRLVSLPVSSSISATVVPMSQISRIVSIWSVSRSSGIGGLRGGDCYPEEERHRALLHRVDRARVRLDLNIVDVLLARLS